MEPLTGVVDGWCVVVGGAEGAKELVGCFASELFGGVVAGDHQEVVDHVRFRGVSEPLFEFWRAALRSAAN